MKKNKLRLDKKRNKNLPLFQITYRLYHRHNNMVWEMIFKALHRMASWIYKCEIPVKTEIGDCLYIGHPYCITINPHSTIGNNCNIHKGVTIGQENRGKRKGAPNIGNKVWIGVNSTIVGNIHVGDDVLIAPNTYVNCDIPSHSIVFGNPCIIKSVANATDGYIDNL